MDTRVKAVLSAFAILVVGVVATLQGCNKTPSPYGGAGPVVPTQTIYRETIHAPVVIEKDDPGQLNRLDRIIDRSDSVLNP